MKYKVTLNDRTYEVEVEAHSATSDLASTLNYLTSLVGLN